MHGRDTLDGISVLVIERIVRQGLSGLHTFPHHKWESEGVLDLDETDGDTRPISEGGGGGGADIEGTSSILRTETLCPASEGRGLGAVRYRVQEIDKTDENTRAFHVR